jgi:hypothetical protein
MSRDDEPKDLRLFDNRTIERNIRKGLITRKDYEKHLKSLEDVTDKIAPKDAPPSIAPSAPRPVEYQAAPIIAIPPAPGSAELRIDDDIDDDEDDDIDELDDDDLEEPTSNGTAEEPPKT